MRITKFVILLVCVLAIVALVNVVVLFPERKEILTAVDDTKEQQRPAELSAVHISPRDCSTCLPLTPFLDRVKQSNVLMQEERLLSFDDNDAQELIAQYGIVNLPALLVRGEVEKNDDLRPVFAAIGEIVDGDTFILRRQNPPYEEIETGNVRGQFIATYITDVQCEECYDVMRHAGALQNFGMVPTEDRVVDIQSEEGRALRRQYALTAVPTILLSGDLGVYGALVSVWPSVGTIEEDGTYIFREEGIMIAQMGVYRDLRSGAVRTPSPQDAGGP